MTVRCRRAVEFGEIMVWLRGQLPPESIITNGRRQFLEPGCIALSLQQIRDAARPDLRSMGYGLPAAVVRSGLFPERTVRVRRRDGDFLMTGRSFRDAVQYDLPIIVLR